MNIIFFAIKVVRRISDILTDMALSSVVHKMPSAKFTKSANVINISKKRKNIIIGDKTIIDGELLIFGYGGRIEIGEYCYIGPQSRIWSGESILIGDNVLISHQCNIIDTTSHELDKEERETGYKNLISIGHPKVVGTIATKPITIKNNAWISFGATILKGVTIGEGAIVAARSVVTKDVPPFTIVAGNPAKIVKEIPL